MRSHKQFAWFWLAIASVVVLGPVAILGVGCLRFGNFVFGPGRAGYQAVDGDAKLTRVAKTALPLIDAIRQYRQTHGDYPVEVAAVRRFLSDASVDPHTDTVNGWRYFPTTTPAGFVLSKSLGWDPKLEYRCRGSSATLVYDPGHGTEEQQIRLNPCVAPSEYSRRRRLAK